MRAEKEKAPASGGALVEAVDGANDFGQFCFSEFIVTRSVAPGQGEISTVLGVGPNSAIKLSDLTRLVGRDERTVRLMIEAERRRYVQIVSDNARGYWISASQDETMRCVRSMRHRAAEILKTAQVLEDAAMNSD